MMRDGRHVTHMREFGDEMCRRIVAAGIPLWRAFCAEGTLHPQIAATAYIWRRSTPGAVRFTANHSFENDPEFTTSPIAEVQRTGRMIRRQLHDPACALDYPALSEFKSEGGTDYAAMPMICSSGEINSITWLTDRSGGFSEDEIGGLGAVAEALAIIVELQATRRIARHLMDTYVGHRTGERVLAGKITRGSGEQIRAVVWLCDLRGFTAMTDSLPRDKVIGLLNDYFETMVDAVTAEGGEALKFMGDGMLAIFELGANEDPRDRCAAALRAARAATEKVAVRNLERRAAGDPEIHFGLALHLGDVSYGNIGAPTRLDFTVIGPAVNHAARLEKVGVELGRPVVT
ncbi:MAG TPA: adenylate/guanylate cyclase domain-containing protein, partial [Candidatus Binatus sp.]|uniref:adenylate/guanylate cyclase domain-containing protein n=1 Tax=Candidatus Binatus sp. TaxID=2811406 RepID=UPI002F429177